MRFPPVHHPLPAVPAPGAGLPPPPPPPPLPDPNQVRDIYDLMMEDARDEAKRKAAEQAKVAQDKLEEYLAQGGFYTALAEFLVDLPMFPYACMKGPTVRIKTQVKWTKDVSPFPTSAQSGPALPGSTSAYHTIPKPILVPVGPNSPPAPRADPAQSWVRKGAVSALGGLSKVLAQQ